MATTYPVTMEELQNITGVGAGKAKRYGEEFLKVIKTTWRETKSSARRTCEYDL